ncbi:hypothetical protein [uncultured Roseibium sp.]|uniref:hypothetical protein n=1 Tax=uncultured Roseibium sp. TaxID=1936171 RepID=UPI00259A8189|nr:hypothetical protein [uncultured Roseibium sp.]
MTDSTEASTLEHCDNTLCRLVIAIKATISCISLRGGINLLKNCKLSHVVTAKICESVREPETVLECRVLCSLFKVRRENLQSGQKKPAWTNQTWDEEKLGRVGK